MRLRILCFVVSTIGLCHCCARTAGGPGGGIPAPGTPGSPGSPGGPGATTAAPKTCPALMTFTPTPAANFLDVAPVTTTTSGTTTTGSCTSAGSSLLLPMGTGAMASTATLSCDTSTGVWALSDMSAFDSTTTPVACGIVCMACSATLPSLPVNIYCAAASTDTGNVCMTPSATCTAPDMLVGVNADGSVVNSAANVVCHGGQWTDDAGDMFPGVACKDTSKCNMCDESAVTPQPAMCNMMFPGRCTAPTVASNTYMGPNTQFVGCVQITSTCPAGNSFFASVLPPGGVGAMMNIVVDNPTDFNAMVVCDVEAGQAVLYQGDTVAGVIATIACLAPA